MYNARGEERQRSYSLGESAAHVTGRPSALLSTRSGVNTPGVANAEAGTSGINAPMHRQNSLSATFANSQSISGRASPALSIGSRRSARTNSQRGASRMPPPLASTISSGPSSYVHPTLKNLDSYSSRTVAAALEPGAEARQVDDVWQAVCLRVLPLL